jgi:hypothetical protein
VPAQAHRGGVGHSRPGPAAHGDSGLGRCSLADRHRPHCRAAGGLLFEHCAGQQTDRGREHRSGSGNLVEVSGAVSALGMGSLALPLSPGSGEFPGPPDQRDRDVLQSGQPVGGVAGCGGVGEGVGLGGGGAGFRLRELIEPGGVDHVSSERWATGCGRGHERGVGLGHDELGAEPGRDAFHRVPDFREAGRARCPRRAGRP